MLVALSAKADAIAQLGGVSACRHINPVRRAAIRGVSGEVTFTATTIISN